MKRINWGEMTEEETVEVVREGLLNLSSESLLEIYKALKRDIEGEEEGN